MHQGAGTGDVAPPPVVQPSEQVQARRQLGPQLQALRVSAQLGELGAQVAGVVEAERRVQEDVDQLEVERDPLRGREPTGPTPSSHR